MKNNEKEKRKPLTELTLLDRFLFDTAMNDPEFCHNVLSIIFDDELPPVHIGMTERKIEPYYASRAVRVYCKIELPKVADGNWRMLQNIRKKLSGTVQRLSGSHQV